MIVGSLSRARPKNVHVSWTFGSDGVQNKTKVSCSRMTNGVVFVVESIGTRGV